MKNMEEAGTVEKMSSQYKTDMMTRVLNDMPCRLSEFYSRPLRTLIFQMLQKNPDERPSTH
jgi:hypothetical protein